MHGQPRACKLFDWISDYGSRLVSKYELSPLTFRLSSRSPGYQSKLDIAALGDDLSDDGVDYSTIDVVRASPNGSASRGGASYRSGVDSDETVWSEGNAGNYSSILCMTCTTRTTVTSLFITRLYLQYL